MQHVHGWELSNKDKVVVKSFSGATTEDMEDYGKPIILKEPENLILHVGTNDLKFMDPVQLTESNRPLAQKVEYNSPNTSHSIDPPKKGYSAKCYISYK